MDFALVTDELATRLEAIDGLRVHAFEAATIQGESAIFGYPTEYEFDQSYNRGLDRLKLPLVVVVPNPTSRTTRDKLAKYCTGSGDYSVKQALEDDTIPPVHFSTVRVESLEIGPYTINNVAYVGAEFIIDITGSGVEEEE